MNSHDRANRITDIHKQIGIKTGFLDGISIDTAKGQELKREVLELQAELSKLQNLIKSD